MALVFGGQGGHVLGAGRALYQQSATFRHLLDQTLEQAAAYWPHDLRRVLWEEEALWDQVDIQPALFCLQVSLARLWNHYGLRPSAVLGHSLGEYAAACQAGVFSLPDGLQLVTTRARLMRELPTAGGMLVVWAESAAGADPAGSPGSRPWTWPPSTGRGKRSWPARPRRSRSCSSSSTHSRSATRRSVPRTLSTRRWSNRSWPPLPRWRSSIRYAPPQLPYFSSTLGRRAGDEVAQATYWQQHLRQSVRFHDAASCLLADKPTAILEVGAGSTLVSLLRSGFRQQDLRLLKGLSGSGEEWPEHLRQLGQLYVLGAPLDWQSVWSGPDRHITGRKISLPTYPFETQRYWFAAAEPASQPVRDRRRTARPSLVGLPPGTGRSRDCLRDASAGRFVPAGPSHWLPDPAAGQRLPGTGPGGGPGRGVQVARRVRLEDPPSAGIRGRRVDGTRCACRSS